MLTERRDDRYPPLCSFASHSRLPSALSACSPVCSQPAALFPDTDIQSLHTSTPSLQLDLQLHSSFLPFGPFIFFQLLYRALSPFDAPHSCIPCALRRLNYSPELSSLFIFLSSLPRIRAVSSTMAPTIQELDNTVRAFYEGRGEQVYLNYPYYHRLAIFRTDFGPSCSKMLLRVP